MKTNNNTENIGWQKRLCILVAVVIIATCLCLTMVGCNKRDKSVMSSETLNITSHLGEYDETEFRAQMSVENDIELADPNIKWDDVLGEYTLI